MYYNSHNKVSAFKIGSVGILKGMSYSPLIKIIYILYKFTTKVHT